MIAHCFITGHVTELSIINQSHSNPGWKVTYNSLLKNMKACFIKKKKKR